MKKIISTIVLSIGLCAPVVAETNTGFYFGLTAGSDKIDAEGVDDASGAGLMAGWRFNENIALEFAGHASDADADDILPGCVFEIDTIALYMAARTSGQVYAKGRIGALSETVTPRDTCSFVDEETESGLSAGIGAGVRAGQAAFELEYTIVEQDVSRISISAIYNF